MLPDTPQRLLIRTPEGIELTMQPAGPFSRFVAWIIDIGCIMTVLTILSQLLEVISLLSRSYGIALHVLLSFVTSMGYGIVLEWFWRGQTLGKRLTHLRVIDEEGLRLGFSQVVVRNLMRALDALPLCYLVGGLCSAWSSKGQRLGDLVASTVVVRIVETGLPDLEKLAMDNYNSLRECPHLAARLRRRVTMDEASLVLRALMRRDALNTQSRIELFHHLAEHFKAIVPFPRESLDGLADERYLRNVVDVIFQSRSRDWP